MECTFAIQASWQIHVDLAQTSSQLILPVLPLAEFSVLYNSSSHELELDVMNVTVY
jgi:hypothetical protein